MLIHIAKKEIIEHVRSFRFVTAFLFILVTFLVMMLTRHFEYKSKYHDYLLRISAQEEALSKYANYNRIGGIKAPIVPPSPLEIIVDPAMPIVQGSPMDSSIDDDPFSKVKINMDIIALVGLLGSLLALLLSYDAINREVNEGTIRLLLSSGAPRMKIILGKIAGGSMAAILPIVAIFIILCIWFAIVGGQPWGTSQWMSLLGIFLVSIIYVMFFYCLGAFVSSVITDHTLSALSCFGIWILFVIVVPVISPYIAKTTVKIPNPVQMQRQINHIYNVERDEAVRAVFRELLAKGMPEQEISGAIDYATINKPFNERVNALTQNYEKAAFTQVMVSVATSCVSPYSAYMLAVEELSCLGIGRFSHLGNVTANWSQLSGEYIKGKYEEARRLNPAHGLGSKLDLSDMPRFNYIDSGITFNYLRALPFIALLFFYFLAPIFLYLQAYIRKKGILRLSF
ncbi:MAG: ABC transporter permease [Holophagaceae bacterium]|nr:ABC transporter permease [Holophagaceae bacterium]